jgi:hypothetical protein
VRKSPRRATLPRILPSTKIQRMGHRATLGDSRNPEATTDEGTDAYADANIVVVECPYCGGEKVLPENGALHNHHREIACKHCQCLFLLSQSRQGVQYRSQQQPGAA